jgi:ergothioneine biosynthesis protein EgtB
MSRPSTAAPVLADRFRAVRARTEALCAPLAIEDHVVQSMPDASPPKWHLAHTTWFFETFVLEGRVPEHRAPPPEYGYLFNSYYEGVGPQFPRGARGTLSRPTVAEVGAWRRSVDESILGALERDRLDDRGRALVELGLHHEEQHQELLVVDLKHALLQNPLDTPIVPPPATPEAPTPPGFVDVEGGLVEVGFEGPGFAYDNEGPRHRAFLEDFRLARSLVTCGEFLEFVRDGGYQRPELWLSDAWLLVQEEGWRLPLYWEEEDGALFERTLGGRRPLAPHAPLAHVSFFEADAYARWRGARLPTEAEWEVAATRAEPDRSGTFLDDGPLHPEGRGQPPAGGFHHLLGEVWEHTASPYRPYPGYQPPAGAVGEYNGKFMNGQYVLRGGSAGTPRDHVRLTYRNFFGPDKKWNFTGIRLAADIRS